MGLQGEREARAGAGTEEEGRGESPLMAALGCAVWFKLLHTWSLEAYKSWLFLEAIIFSYLS